LATVLKALVLQAGLDPGLEEDVYAGCGNQAGEDNRDVARMAALLAGFPVEVSGITVNRNCSSGLDAVNLAAKSILAGESDDLLRFPPTLVEWALRRAPSRIALCRCGGNLVHDVGYLEAGLTTSPEMILFTVEATSMLRRALWSAPLRGVASGYAKRP
jgi:hypothetical protein